MPERIEVPSTIAADAAVIFGVLCDPQGHGGYEVSGLSRGSTARVLTATDRGVPYGENREAGVSPARGPAR